jgi:Cu(I)/Ag(I) efflux system membrane protein CusA/SilA
VINRLIAWSVHNRLIVMVLTGLLLFGGIWAVRTTPVDAIPDLSDVQVIVYTEFPGQAPQVVEDQVTYPLTTAMLSVPYAATVRGYSFFGFSMVYVIFEDGTDLYWARSRVLESLNVAQGRLPEGVTTRLGPDATGVGWVFQYTLSDFGPRSYVLRQNLDADGDGTVTDAELPDPGGWIEIELDAVDVDGHRMRERRPAYTDAQIDRFFADPPEALAPPGTSLARRFGSDSARYLVECFDADRDGVISKPELARAVAFGGIDLAQLRSLQDWFLRYELMALKGVSEVASVGGFVKQYQVEVDPERLRAFGIPLGDVRRAIQRSNLDVGGRLIEMGETEFMVRGKGYISSTEDLANTPIGVDQDTHTPILLSQVARIQIGPEIRRGLVEMDGQGEVVSGIVVARYGANALAVIDRVKERLVELRSGLPEGVEIHISYDRSDLIRRAISVLQHKLAEELLAVALICLLFLFHVRSALVAIVTLPAGILAAFLLMRLLGLNANIMSLGGIAIAIGVMVDASIVLVENLHKHKERYPERSHTELVIGSAQEVGPALFYSLLIVTVSFLPVFALEAQEGRMFRPLAFTKTFAMGSSALISVTLVPVLLFYFVRGRTPKESANPISRLLIWMYRPMLRGVLRFPRTVIVVAVLTGAAAIYPYSQLGSEFMPPLNEGDLLYMPTTPPGISITKARELLQQTDRIIAMHPQVEHVLGKIGRAETATDPAPLSMIETTILLTDPDTWPKGKTIEDVAAELDEMVQFPGLTNAWTMPIKTRIDMLATGIKTPVGIKLLGDDLEQLSELGQQIEALVRGLDGTKSVYSERVVGGNYIDIEVDRLGASRFGLTVQDVQDIVRTAIGGMNVTWTVEGRERYPVNLRFPRELRNDLESLRRIAVPTPMGHTVPLGQVASIEVTKGPPAIKSEGARPTAWIYVDLDTSDVGGYVRAARKAVRNRIDIPDGVSIVWSGQYEYMERANERLRMVVPITLFVIFLLLYMHFGNLPETAIVMGTLPFALVGGIWLLWGAGFNLSVAVGVGFIALAGLAAETGVVMIVYLDETWQRWREEGRLRGVADLKRIVMEGAVDRVRPKVMTVAATLFGLLPIMWGTGTGTRVMKRIAAPMVGGVVSSTILTLLIVPAVWYLWRRHQLAREAP